MKLINQRTLIRNQIGILLLKGKTLAEDRIELNSVDPDWDDDESLPALRVYYDTEEITKFNDSPREYRKDPNFVIEITAASKRDPETNERIEAQDQTDEIDQQIRNILLVDETLGGVCEDLAPAGNTWDFSHAGKREIVTQRSVYLISHVEKDVEDISDQKQLGLAEFKIVKTNWNIDKSNDNDDPTGNLLIEAKDETNLPQT